MSYEDGTITGTRTLTLTLTLILTGTITLTLTLIIIPLSLTIHDAIASWRHTPQSLRDSSPNLGEQFLYLRI